MPPPLPLPLHAHSPPLPHNPPRARLAKLLRFHSSKSPSNFTSLDGYVSRLQPGQKSIYWIAGMSQDEVAASPFAEKLVAEVREGAGVRVVFFSTF